MNSLVSRSSVQRLEHGAHGTHEVGHLTVVQRRHRAVEQVAALGEHVERRLVAAVGERGEELVVRPSYAGIRSTRPSRSSRSTSCTAPGWLIRSRSARKAIGRSGYQSSVTRAAGALAP